MYGITFGFDLKNRNQKEDFCGATTPIYLDINSKRDLGYLEKYVQALTHLSDEKLQAKLIISMNGLLTAIFIRDIFYVEIFKRIISIHHKDGISDTYAKLTTTETILSAFGFTRAQRSYIVAINAIKTLSKKTITLINGEKIPVSKTYYNEVQSAFLAQGLYLGK